LEFLKPGVEAINRADHLKIKGADFKKWGNHYKAFYELIMGISWVTMTPPNGLPFQHVESQVGATDFNLLRIQRENKDDKNKAFVTTMKAVNKREMEIVKEYFKRDGLTWNEKGGDFKGFKGGAAPAEESKEAPKEAKAAASEPAKGMDSVFGELNKGLKVTSGLKKVTPDMKAKNRADRSGKVEMKEKKGEKKQKPPKGSSLKGGRWVVENYDEEMVVVDKATVKNNVYISNCDETTIEMKEKVKAISVDSCRKCRIFINEVVSTVEMVNCHSVTLVVQQVAPSISIEKSTSPRIVLMKPAFLANPQIYTSNISAMNVEVPGETEKDDMIEIPIPEQYLTRIDVKTKKATTVEVAHG